MRGAEEAGGGRGREGARSEPARGGATREQASREPARRRGGRRRGAMLRLRDARGAHGDASGRLAVRPSALLASFWAGLKTAKKFLQPTGGGCSPPSPPVRPPMAHG